MPRWLSHFAGDEGRAQQDIRGHRDDADSDRAQDDDSAVHSNFYAGPRSPPSGQGRRNMLQTFGSTASALDDLRSFATVSHAGSSFHSGMDVDIGVQTTLSFVPTDEADHEEEHEQEEREWVEQAVDDTPNLSTDVSRSQSSLPPLHNNPSDSGRSATVIAPAAAASSADPFDRSLMSRQNSDSDMPLALRASPTRKASEASFASKLSSNTMGSAMTITHPAPTVSFTGSNQAPSSVVSTPPSPSPALPVFQRRPSQRASQLGTTSYHVYNSSGHDEGENSYSFPATSSPRCQALELAVPAATHPNAASTLSPLSSNMTRMPSSDASDQQPPVFAFSVQAATPVIRPASKFPYDPTRPSMPSTSSYGSPERNRNAAEKGGHPEDMDVKKVRISGQKPATMLVHRQSFTSSKSDESLEVPTATVDSSNATLLNKNSRFFRNPFCRHKARNSTSTSDDFTEKSAAVFEREHQTHIDAERLKMLGYDQVLNRNYDALASFSLSLVNIGFLQGALTGVAGSTPLGGPRTLIGAIVLNGIMATTLAAVSAEFASAWPVAGAFFTWTYKLARGSPRLRNWARFISFVCGVYVLIGHFVCLLAISYAFSRFLQATIALQLPSYDPQVWHATLIGIATLFATGFSATTRTGQSPVFWKCAALFMFATWALIIFSMAFSTKSRRDPHVLGKFLNLTSLPNSYATFLGFIGTTTLTGFDCSAHIAEETKQPARNAPLGMFWSPLITTILCVTCSIAIMSRTTLPVSGEGYQAPVGIILDTLPDGLALTVLSFIILAMFLQGIAQLQTTTRVVFALARDSALPYANWIVNVDEETHLPQNATWLLIISAATLSLCQFAGSRPYFTAVVSALNFAYYIGYATPLAIYLFSGQSLQADGRSEWTLRKASRPLGVIALLYCVTLFIGLSVPNSTKVTAANFPWSPIVAILLFLITVAAWVTFGDRNYSGPVRALTKYTTGAEIDLATTVASVSMRMTEQEGSEKRPRDSKVSKTKDKAGTAADLSYSSEIPYSAGHETSAASSIKRR